MFASSMNIFQNITKCKTLKHFFASSILKRDTHPVLTLQILKGEKTTTCHPYHFADEENKGTERLNNMPRVMQRTEKSESDLEFAPKARDLCYCEAVLTVAEKDKEGKDEGEEGEILQASASRNSFL